MKTNHTLLISIQSNKKNHSPLIWDHADDEKKTPIKSHEIEKLQTWVNGQMNEWFIWSAALQLNLHVRQIDCIS
jgi:hypothetical protein